MAVLRTRLNLLSEPQRGAPLALVLCTGVDAILMETRRLILERAGHAVVSAMNEREVTTACMMNRFQIAVIGQSVSTQSKRSIAHLVRQHCPSAKILELYSSYEDRVLNDEDSWLEVPANIPNDLGDEVTRLAEAFHSA